MFFYPYLVSSVLAVFVLITACRRDEEPAPETHELIVFDYSVDQLQMLDTFEHASTVGGQINHPSLVEASGIAVSRQNPLWTWSHNDSGHPNRIFLLDEHGQDRGTFVLNGAGSRDYEDICIGPGPQPGVNYIYLGDIGDNQAQYNYIVVYRFPEPDIQSGTPGSLTDIDGGLIERFEFVYPDSAHDAETLMIDPSTLDLYLVTKRDFRSLIYRANYPFSPSGRDTLELLAQLPFNWALGGDISDDGRHIAVKDTENIYYWNRHPAESVVEAMARQPRLLPYIVEPKGESFAWGPNASSYFTLSEQINSVPSDLYHYKYVD